MFLVHSGMSVHLAGKISASAPRVMCGVMSAISGSRSLAAALRQVRSIGVLSRITEAARVIWGGDHARTADPNDPEALDRRSRKIRWVGPTVAGQSIGIDLRKVVEGDSERLATADDYNLWLQGKPFACPIAGYQGEVWQTEPGLHSFPIEDHALGGPTLFLPNALQLGSARIRWLSYLFQQYQERYQHGDYAEVGINLKRKRWWLESGMAPPPLRAFFHCRADSLQRLAEEIKKGHFDAYRLRLFSIPIQYPDTVEALIEMLHMEELSEVRVRVGPDYGVCIGKGIGYPPRAYRSVLADALQAARSKSTKADW